MDIDSRPDYGAKGCCGPLALALLAALVAAVALAGWFA